MGLSNRSRLARFDIAPLTCMGLVFCVLFSDVELPEFGGIVASAEAADVDTSTDEVAPVLVDVEDKTVEEERAEEVIVEEKDVDVAAASVVVAELDSETGLALGAGSSPVESTSQEE